MNSTTPPLSAPLPTLVSKPPAPLTKAQGICGSYINLEAGIESFSSDLAA